MNQNQDIAAIILAAGRGVRMKSKKINKVMLDLAGKPMISHTLDLLREVNIPLVVIVVGFAKESVKKFAGSKYLYVEQKKRMGTAHAVKCALIQMPASFKDILVFNGDDSAFYRPETIEKLVQKHQENQAGMTLLTIESKNPYGLGRIIRDARGELVGIIEEKDATENQRKINEINPACYIFNRNFLAKYLPKVEKSPVSGEYYLTDLIRLGIKNREKVESMKVKNLTWRGINTWEELKKAEELMKGDIHVN